MTKYQIAAAVAELKSLPAGKDRVTHAFYMLRRDYSMVPHALHYWVDVVTTKAAAS